jgi:5-methylcytosine-specific restriction endonuclease McrA
MENVCSKCGQIRKENRLYKNTRRFSGMCKSCAKKAWENEPEGVCVKCGSASGWVRSRLCRSCINKNHRETSNPICESGTRKCTKCKKEKARNICNFSKKGASKDGLSTWCKECAAEHAKKESRKIRKTEEGRIRKNSIQNKYRKSAKGIEYKKYRTPSDNAIRRSRLRNRAFDWSPEKWLDCCSDWDNKCAYCGSDAALTQDHFIPLSNDETPGTVPWNMLPACAFCNASKGHKSPFEWVKNEENIQRIMSYLESKKVASENIIKIIL